MTDEDRSAHDSFCGGIILCLAPVGEMEIQLAQRVATDSWRLNRGSAIEDNLFALGLSQHAGAVCPENPEVDSALTTARVFTLESKQLELLTLYEQRINRNLQKTLAMLQAMQAARKEERRTQMPLASRLLQLSEMNNLDYDPAKDGFVFSNHEIHADIDRNLRLETAWDVWLRRPKPKNVPARAA
jgi:hypothetical protein